MADLRTKLIIQAAVDGLSQIRELVHQIDDIGDESQESAKQADALLADLQRIAQQSLDAPVEDQERLARETKKTRQELDRLNTELRELASTKPPPDPTRQMREGADKTSNVIRGIPGLLAAIGVSVGLAQVVQAFTDAAKSGESFSRALNIITGSAEEATAQQQRLLDISQKYGLEVTGLERAFTNFQASIAGTNFEGERGNEIFETFAASLGLLGKSSADIEGALLAVNQIISKNTVSSEELKQQLSERLPKAYRLAAEAMELTTAELDKQLELGNITADELLPKLADRLRDAYSLDTVERVEGLSAAQNRLSTATTNLFRAIAESGVGDFIADVLGELSNVFIDITQAIDGTSDGVFGLAQKADEATPAIAGLGTSAETTAGQIGQVKTAADGAADSIVKMIEAQRKTAEVRALDAEYVELQAKINEGYQRAITLQQQLANESDPFASQEIQNHLRHLNQELDDYRESLDKVSLALRERFNPETEKQRQKTEQLNEAIGKLTTAQRQNLQELDRLRDAGRISADTYEQMRDAITGVAEAEKERITIAGQSFNVTAQQAKALQENLAFISELEDKLRAAGKTEQEIAVAREQFTASILRQAEAYVGLGDAAEQAAKSESTIGNIKAAFDGSVESVNRVIDGLRVQQTETKKVAAATDEAAEAGERQSGSIEIASSHLREMAERASAARDSLVEAGQSGSDEFSRLNQEIDSLLGNLEVINEFGRSPRDFRANFDYGFGELIRNAERARDVLGEVDRVMVTLGDDTSRVGELTQALARANSIARNQAELLGQEKLNDLRSAIADARKEMEGLGEQTDDTRKRIADLDAEIAEAQGDTARAELLRLELEFQEKIAAVELQIAQARLSGNRELISLLEDERERLEELQALREQAIKDEERLRKEQEKSRSEPVSSNPPSSSGGSGGGSGGNGQQVVVVPISERALQDSILTPEAIMRIVQPELDRLAALQR